MFTLVDSRSRAAGADSNEIVWSSSYVSDDIKRFFSLHKIIYMIRNELTLAFCFYQMKSGH